MALRKISAREFQLRLLVGIAAVSLTCSLCPAEDPRHPKSDGFSTDVSFDYDGSRSRTAAFRGGMEIDWRGDKTWLELELDTYTDFKSKWAFNHDVYAGIATGIVIYKSHEERLYINAKLSLSGPSQLADTGVDITAEVSVAKGLTKDWWLGGELARVVSTSHNLGSDSGYISLTTWAMWFSRWLPNESDAFKLSMWAATNEVRGAGNALFFSLTYEFDLTDQLETSIGIGTDPYSPWERLGFYATAGLRWRF